jgi:hypothetical protein
MVDHRDLTKIMDNVEEDLKHAPTPAPRTVESIERFVPQKYRNNTSSERGERGDTMEQIQQDFRKAIADMESRTKALVDELKRIAN